MKKLFFCFVAGTLLQSGLMAQVKKAPAKSTTTEKITSVASPKNQMKNDLDSFSYAVGLNIAENMKGQGITELNIQMMSNAFDDVFKGKPQSLTTEQATMTLQKKMQEFSERKSGEQKEFCSKNKTKAGVITLPDGLQYEIITAGEPNGMKPTAADTVVVDYVGTLIDGKEFDNSIKRGEPATFPVGGVIKGWTEILQLMTKGAHWRVVIPAELGYGERGAGGAIPPNATLIFEITLRDIKPAVTQ